MFLLPCHELFPPLSPWPSGLARECWQLFYYLWLLLKDGVIEHHSGVCLFNGECIAVGDIGKIMRPPGARGTRFWFSDEEMRSGIRWHGTPSPSCLQPEDWQNWEFQGSRTVSARPGCDWSRTGAMLMMLLFYFLTCLEKFCFQPGCVYRVTIM